MLTTYTLSNGIPLIISENHSAPVATVQAWVKRGSVHEPEKLAGISHFLEHALFKGTGKRAVGEIAKEIEGKGGEINAFTSFEETVYYATLSSRYSMDGLDVICDAIQNPSFDPEEMEREKEVILEEILRNQDSPFRTVSTQLWKTCFAGSPYGRPVIGFPETVSKIKHNTLSDYFKNQYNTKTVCMVVAGDVDPQKIKAKAESLLKRMKGGNHKELPKILKFPRYNNIQVVSQGRDIQECHVQIAFPTASITDKSIPSTDIAISAVGQGESGRLYQRLIKESQKALEAHFGVVATARCGMAVISLTTAPEMMIGAVNEARKFVEEILESGIETAEIDRVKSSLEAEVVAGKETVEGTARRLGSYYLQFGDASYEKKYLNDILSVDSEQAYTSFQNTVTKTPIISIVHPSKMKVNQKELLKAVTLRPNIKRQKALPKPKLLKKEILGIRIIEKISRSLPLISLKFIFQGGSRQERSHEYGMSHLLQRLWTTGTPHMTSVQIAKELEAIGASLYGFSGKNTHGLSVEFLPKHWGVVKPILNDVLLHPTFPEQEFETEKNLLLRDILSEKDTPTQLCHHNLQEKLFGEHPFGRSPLGTADSVKSFSRDQLHGFYKDVVSVQNLVISTVGDFAEHSWAEELGRLCHPLPATTRSPVTITMPKKPTTPEIVTISKKPLFQSQLMIGFLGPDLRNPDRYALKLLSSSLSGQGGRLFLELRDKKSLAYSVSPMHYDSIDLGMFGFYIGCAPDKLTLSIQEIRNELQRVLDKPISEKELKRAKEYWLGRFELDLQRYSAQAMLYGLDETYGLGFEYHLKVTDKIKNVTAKEINQTAQKYLNPKHATLSIVHPETLTSEEVLRYWR